MGYKFCLSDISSFPLSHDVAVQHKKWQQKVGRRRLRASMKDWKSDIEWKWKNHHHNSKAVRKRFSILLLLSHAFAWLASQSHPSSNAMALQLNTKKKLFVAVFLHMTMKKLQCCISICIMMKKRDGSAFSHFVAAITVSITLL
jgi:hypothetical protein